MAASQQLHDSCLENVWAIRLETLGAAVQQLSGLQHLANHLIGLCGALATQPYKVP
jgi:hypothetical protein